ncbi:hypothetical protein OROHE_008234 [Orobanche hederae]
MSIPQRKKEYVTKMISLLDQHQHQTIIVVCVDHVGSNQLHSIRKMLRSLSLLGILSGNMGLIFTKGELLDIVRKELTKTKFAVPARVGLVAREDVLVPPGNTGLDPSQSSFFQALNISTRINRGTVEILSEIVLVKKGQQIGNSQAVLLSKLGIRPFYSSVDIVSIYQNGCVFGPEILDITADDLLEKFSAGISNIASVSLSISYPTLAAAHHMFINGLKNVIAVALATNYPLTRTSEFLRKVHGLPLDLHESILTRFPAQSLLRFRSICHYLRYTIDTPRLGLAHYELSKEAYLVTCIEGTATVGWRSNTTNPFRVSLKLDDLDRPNSQFRGACNGLLLFSDIDNQKLYIISPMRGELLDLPTPKFFSNTPSEKLATHMFGFGYYNGSYKIVSSSKWRYNSFPKTWTNEILTLGDGRWRQLKSRNIRGQGASISFGQYVYWSRAAAAVGQGGDTVHLNSFVCFDMEDETYNLVRGPRKEQFLTPHLVDLRGTLGIVYVGRFKSGHDIEIYQQLSVEDYCQVHKISISHIIGTSMDINVVKVIGMIGNSVIIYYRTEMLVLTYDVDTKVATELGTFSDGTDPSFSLLERQFWIQGWNSIRL